MIVVIGATGTVGGGVVERLRAAGVRVRAMTRNPDGARFPSDVDVVRGDLTSPDSLPAVLRGADGVFIASTVDPAVADATLAGAAVEAGVRRIVKLSVIGAQDRARGERTPSRGHIEGERAIERSGLEWTFVRPGGFMSNALGWADSLRERGTVFAPFADVPAAPVHPGDIAAVAALALTGDGHAGAAYPLSGPEVLTPREQTAMLAYTLGREIEFVPVPDEKVRQNMLARGLPREQVDNLFADLDGGDLPGARVWPTVGEVTGAPPRDFAQWVTEHRAAFD